MKISRLDPIDLTLEEFTVNTEDELQYLKEKWKSEFRELNFCFGNNITYDAFCQDLDSLVFKVS